MIRTRFNSWKRNDRGATLVEFAIVAPIMLLLIMGLAELCYQAYVQAVLSGAIQKAGRDSTIEDASSTTTTIDATVMRQVNAAAPRATGTSTRKSYAEFGYIDEEPFTDTNGDGIREPGECFTDINGNGTWDADPGISGQGNASDAVVYTMTVTYPRLFPLYNWLGWSRIATVTATTVLKNQPYAAQSITTPATICT